MKFGDLFFYKRPGYKHWVVYTGKNEKGENTVVEFTGEKGLNSKAGATVKKGLLMPNYIDGNQYHNETAKSEAVMKENVEKVLRDGAGAYGILNNNCEHLATFIRYGKPLSIQANIVVNTAADFTNEMADTFGSSSFPSPNMKFK